MTDARSFSGGAAVRGFLLPPSGAAAAVPVFGFDTRRCLGCGGVVFEPDDWCDRCLARGRDINFRLPRDPAQEIEIRPARVLPDECPRPGCSGKPEHFAWDGYCTAYCQSMADVPVSTIERTET